MDQVSLGSRVLQPHRQLLADGERIALGKRALDILSVLAEARGEIVTKEELFEAVWPDVIVEENALQVQVAAIRKALGEDAKLLKTIRGVGYQLDVSGQSEVTEDVIAPANSRIGAEDAANEERALHRRARLRSLVLLAIATLLTLGMLYLWSPTATIGDSRSDGASAEVVIMPFAAAGSDPGEAALASGITSELIVRLRRVPGLTVRVGATGISNGSAGSGLQNRLDGTVRLDGDSLRVSPTLTNTAGEVLWSENFDIELNGLLRAEEDIARAVANSLSVSLSVGVNSRSFGGTDNPEAYADVVQGLVAASQGKPDQAVDYMKQAIARDPDYVQALAGLSSTYGFLLDSVSTRNEADSLLAGMDDASARALMANPDVWMGYSVRGWFELAKGDIAAAADNARHLQDFDTASDPLLKLELARWDNQFGREDAAIEFLKSADLDDPYYRRDLMLTNELVLAGRYDEAIRLYGMAEEQDPTLAALGAPTIYWAYLLSGNENKARDMAKRAKLGPLFEAVPDFHFDPDYMPNLPAARLAQWANRKFGYGGKRQLMMRALFASHFGHQALALEYLNLAFQRPDPGFQNLLWHPALTELRKTREFVKFLEDHGYVDVWRQSGDWGEYCRPLSDIEFACS